MCLWLACRGCAGRALRGALCRHSAGLPAVHLQAPQPEHTVSDGELEKEGAQGVSWVRGMRRGVKGGLSGSKMGHQGFLACSNITPLPPPPGWTHQPNPRSSTRQPAPRTLPEPHASAAVPGPPVQPATPPPLTPTPGQGRDSTPASLGCMGCPHGLFAWGSIWPQQIFLL